MEPEIIQEPTEPQLLERRISRRRAIKAGGIAAVGLAFSKPLIETILPRPAFASLSPAPGGPTELAISGSVTEVSILPGESVDHLTEKDCPTPGAGVPIAGAKVTSVGVVAPLGAVSGEASAAWDWTPPAPPTFVPTAASHGGTLTGFTAKVLASYPHAFCSSSFVATGAAILEDGDGDKLLGMVTGGDIFEVDFGLFPGDGQESFLTVMITGGTGKWSGATGSYTTHSIIKVVAGPALAVVFSEIAGVVFV